MAEIENINESWNNHGFPEVENFIKGQLRTSGKKVALESSGSRFRVNLLDEDDNVLSNSNYISTTAENTMALMDSLLSNVDGLMDYTKSELFEHMVFSEQMTDDETLMATADMVKDTQLKSFCEDEAYQFVRDSAGWDAFLMKWCKHQKYK